jgi:hypothetical protein
MQMQLISFPCETMIVCTMLNVKAIFGIFYSTLVPKQSFYKTIRSQNRKEEVSFYVTGTLLLTYLLLTIFTIDAFIRYDLTNIAPNLVNSLKTYPPDLSITIDKGKLITNYNEPYFMWTTYKGKKMLLLTVDQSANQEKALAYNSILVLGSTNAVFRNLMDGSIKTYEYNQMQLLIDKNTINTYIQKVNEYNSNGYTLIILLFFIGVPLSMLILNGVFLGLASVIVTYIYKYTKIKQITLRQVGKIALYSFTLPLIFTGIISIYSHASLKTVPFMYLFTLTIATFISTQEAYS